MGNMYLTILRSLFLCGLLHIVLVHQQPQGSTFILPPLEVASQPFSPPVAVDKGATTDGFSISLVECPTGTWSTLVLRDARPLPSPCPLP